MIDGFYIGSLKIYFYGIIIMLGVLMAVWISIKQSRRRGVDSEIIWDLIPWLLLGGIVGARLWHVATPSKSMGVGANYYFSHPIEILNIRNGGLGIPGAVIGGVIALLIFTKKKHVDFFVWTDIISPGLALAQAIGRWGNYFNQELYGLPSRLPWAIYIDPGHRLAGYEVYDYYHPMFLYESVWNLLNFCFLNWLGQKYPGKLISGDIFFIYLIIYPFGRFFLEFIRLDASYIAEINANQITMLIVMIVSMGVIIFRHLKYRRNHSEKGG